MSARDSLSARLAQADVQVGGPRPSDLRVRDERFFERVLRGGSLALGESYMEGLWECDDLPGLFERLSAWRNSRPERSYTPLRDRWQRLEQRLLNLRGRHRAREVLDAQHQLPVRLFQRMLGRSMVYSCGYWRDARDLDAAQEAKLELICRKLELRAGQSLLEWGSGFGAFARWAAQRHGCEVVGVNPSSEQLLFARRLCADLPVVFHQCDYRVPQVYAQERRFERFASIGMFEAVGWRNLRRHMELLHGLLADGALGLLHTIGDEAGSHDPWLHRYVFPNGAPPTLGQIASALKGLFEIEDLQNLGPDQARTLQAWEANFRGTWNELRDTDERFDDRFFRTWVYYLGCCQGVFRARKMQVWQIVLSKGRRETLPSVR